MFDVRRLAVLQEVIRCGSLSAAAASLNYTTSAVSQQISALERDVGSTLLVRSPTGARPTVAGRRLLEHADVILGAVAFAERDLALLATASPGVVRVASFASAAAAILPPAFARFRTLVPDVDLELVSADPEEGVAMLGSDGVDAAVITEVPGEDPEFPGVHTVAVYDDEFFVVLPARHRLRAQPRCHSLRWPVSNGWSAPKRAPAPTSGSSGKRAVARGLFRRSPSVPRTIRRCRAWWPRVSVCHWCLRLLRAVFAQTSQ